VQRVLHSCTPRSSTGQSVCPVVRLENWQLYWYHAGCGHNYTELWVPVNSTIMIVKFRSIIKSSSSVGDNHLQRTQAMQAVEANDQSLSGVAHHKQH
jgi:hypothetical protein